MIDVDRLYSACKAITENIAEFGTITDNEFVDELESALSALAAPSPAPAPAEAEQAMETLLMQGRSSYKPSTYDLVITARADTIENLGGALDDIFYYIQQDERREGHEENEYVGYLFKLLSPALAPAPADGDGG